MDPYIALVVTGVLAVLAFGAWVVVKAMPAVRKFTRFIDDLTGEPARSGFEARPGLMERLSSLETSMTETQQTQEVIRRQVQNSHSTNLRDDVDDLKEAVDALHRRWAEPPLGVDGEKGGSDA